MVSCLICYPWNDNINTITGIRPDLANDQFSPPYIFLQDQQTEIQNTNCKNINGVPILDKEIIFMHLPTLCKNYDGENWSLARSSWMPV